MVKGTQQIGMMNQASKLQFTGNWFIDAGILGFVSLMEAVYGWDLEKIEEKIAKDPRKIYYGYFPFAYLYKWLSDRSQEVNHELIVKIKAELEEKDFKSNEDLFDFIWWNFICELFKDSWAKDKSKLIYKNNAYKINKIKKEYDYRNTQIYLQKIEEREKIINEIQKKYANEVKKILKKEKIEDKEDIEKLIEIKDKSIPNDLDKLIELLKEKHFDIINFLKKEWENNVLKAQKFTEEESRFYRIPVDSGFYKNFLFFNFQRGHLEQKRSFFDMVSYNVRNEEMLQKIDKTVNKLLPSEDEFSNISYTKFSSEPFINQIKYLFVYLLCFIYSFEEYKNLGHVLFYSPDLKFSYIVNKKLKLHKKKIEDSRDPNAIFKFTWQQIINLLVEYKSSWSLENMYIISYQRLDNQAQENVEYIGISKLQASILLDDIIREMLNKRVEYRRIKNNFERKWVLEEFIKGKSLYSIIFNHVKLVLDKEINLSYYSSFYSLIVDAKILELREQKESKKLFSENYFNNYKALVNEIKEEIRFTSYKASLIREISKDSAYRERLARELLGALEGEDKTMFLNILLKDLNEEKQLCKNVNFNSWIFEKIVLNDISWKNYALILVTHLLLRARRR
jgi:hypothetical protein